MVNVCLNQVKASLILRVKNSLPEEIFFLVSTDLRRLLLLLSSNLLSISSSPFFLPVSSSIVGLKIVVRSIEISETAILLNLWTNC